MKTSPAGLEFIKNEEGVVLHVYRDQAGIPTIGIGHVLKPGDPIAITEQQALDMLARDLGYVEQCINSYVEVGLAQYQFDALASFVFNVGIAAFTSSTLLRKLNAMDYQGAADEFPRWDKATVGGKKVDLPALLARRERERALFLDEDDTPTVPDTPAA